MFCPRCGQEQAFGDLRFCSRCGLPMGLISEILANGGTLPQLLELNEKSFFSRRNGVVFSLLWFLFFVLILTPFWGILDVEELAGMSAIIGIFGGLMILLFSLLILKPAKKELPNFLQNANINTNTKPAYLQGNQAQNVLPPQQTQNAQEYVSPVSGWKAPDTGELVRPSVTEGTTKLLKKEE